MALGQEISKYNKQYASKRFAIGSFPTSLVAILDRKAPVRATITVETSPIRYRYDGGRPISAVSGGHIAEIGDQFTIEGRLQVGNFTMCSDSSRVADVFVTVEFWR